MKIIMTASEGKLDGYLEDLTENIATPRIQTRFQPLSFLNRRIFSNFLFPPEKRRLDALQRMVMRTRPDVLIFNSSKMRFDFNAVRSFFRGKIVVYDMEGPNFSGFSHPEWIRSVDLVITVSRLSCRILNQRGYDNVVYLPHGVNPERFHPATLEPQEKRFQQKRIFVGRPSPHRNHYFEKLARAGLPVTLYGEKWRQPTIPDILKTSAAPVSNNIHGATLRRVIRGGELFINVLQDQYKDLHTLMNMQIFIVSACRSCMLTEYVEEIEDAFEPEREISVYHSVEELCDKAAYFHKNPSAAGRIAEAAYKRVLKDHTLKQRAAEFRRLIDAL